MMHFNGTMQEAVAILVDASMMRNGNYHNHNTDEFRGGASSSSLSPPAHAPPEPQHHVLVEEKDQEMLQDDNDNDDDTVSSAASSVATTMTTSMTDLETLLDELVNAVHALLQREKCIDQDIAEEVVLATTRHASGSQLGVILCMNKVHSMQFERHRVNAAIQLLEKHITTLESQMEQRQQLAKAAYHQRQSDDDAMMMLQEEDGFEEQEELLPIDIREQRNYAQQVEQILSSPL